MLSWGSLPLRAHRVCFSSGPEGNFSKGLFGFSVGFGGGGFGGGVKILFGGVTFIFGSCGVGTVRFGSCGGTVVVPAGGDVAIQVPSLGSSPRGRPSRL